MRQTGLQVRLVATEYADFPVVEWTVWLKNTGKADTPIIENIQGLDGTLRTRGRRRVRAAWLRGDSCLAESFRRMHSRSGRMR